MKNVMIFLGFILYATAIFFIDNPFLFLVVLLLNLLAMVILRISLVEAIENIRKVLPFVLVTVLINWILENYEYAFLVAIKLLLVCNSTYIYARTTSVREIAITIKNLCMPLKLWKVNLEDIEILVCISLSMLPILKNEYRQLREASLAKGMEINLKNMRPILAKLMVSLMKRVNELEESMIEKGYGEV